MSKNDKDKSEDLQDETPGQLSPLQAVAISKAVGNTEKKEEILASSQFPTDLSGESSESAGHSSPTTNDATYTGLLPESHRQTLRLVQDAKAVELMKQSIIIHRKFRKAMCEDNTELAAMHAEHSEILVQKVKLEAEIDELNHDGRLDSGPLTIAAQKYLDAWSWYDHYRTRAKELNASREEIGRRRDNLFDTYREAHSDMLEALDETLVGQGLLSAETGPSGSLGQAP